MRVREIVGDTQSAEIQQMRRSFNSLLRMMETAEASITTGSASAEEVLGAWADAIRTGRDDNPDTVSNVLVSDEEIVGIRVTPTALRKAQANARVVQDDGTDA